MSSFQGVGIGEFHCIQRCPHFRESPTECFIMIYGLESLYIYLKLLIFTINYILSYNIKTLMMVICLKNWFFPLSASLGM